MDIQLWSGGEEGSRTTVTLGMQSVKQEPQASYSKSKEPQETIVAQRRGPSIRGCNLTEARMKLSTCHAHVNPKRWGCQHGKVPAPWGAGGGGELQSAANHRGFLGARDRHRLPGDSEGVKGHRPSAQSQIPLALFPKATWTSDWKG